MIANMHICLCNICILVHIFGGRAWVLKCVFICIYIYTYAVLTYQEFWRHSGMRLFKNSTKDLFCCYMMFWLWNQYICIYIYSTFVQSVFRSCASIQNGLSRWGLVCWWLKTLCETGQAQSCLGFRGLAKP